MLIMALILVSQVFYDFVYAQDAEQNYDQNVPIVSNPALKLDLKYPEVQEYPSKNFRVTLTVDSLIDSNRVGVKWFYPSNLMTITGEERDIISVVSGEKTTITKEFTPRSEESLPKSVINRRVTLAVEVNGFVAGENYLSSSEVDVIFTPDMEITPTLESYSSDRRTTLLRVWSIRIGIVLAFGTAIVYAVKQLRDYLNTNEVV